MDDTLEKPYVRLTGHDGNAFMILGLCKRAAERSGWTYKDWEVFSAEAMTGDYNHLLATVMKYFEVS